MAEQIFLIDTNYRGLIDASRITTHARLILLGRNIIPLLIMDHSPSAYSGTPVFNNRGRPPHRVDFDTGFHQPVSKQPHSPIPPCYSLSSRVINC